MSGFRVRAHVVQQIAASPEQVFAAWIEPRLMERWLFKSPSNTLRAETRPSPGGSFSIVEHADGKVIDHRGCYSIVDHASRIAFSLVVPQHFAGTAWIDVRLRPSGGGTALNFTASGDGPPEAQQIWQAMLSNLAALLDPGV